MFLPEFVSHLGELISRFFTLDPNDPFKTSAKVATMLGVTITAATTFFTKTYPWLRAKKDSRSVEKQMGAKLFTAASVERSIRYYVPAFCQSIDPAGGEESRLIHSVQAPLFHTLDNALASENKYHILLADSGMGKTSALLNYYVRHIHRWRKKYEITIIPLGIPDADERIKAVENKHKTVLFLDAFDEDTRAMSDHVARLQEILKNTYDFRHVVITCRTQFFSKDEEIPRETGILKFGPRAADEGAEYVFYKIYLSPFSDKQVKKYLKLRYPLWQWRKRRHASRLVAKIPHLTARPMLLAHIDDLVRTKRKIEYSFELYDEMVEAWIRREQGFIKESDELRKFSELLAVDLYVHRQARGAERITKKELTELARNWNIHIIDEKLSARSLLNRDAEGNLKFAHRSIMEWLFVKRFLGEDPQCLSVGWTDQMRTFFWESIVKAVSLTNRIPNIKISELEAENKERLLNILCEMLASEYWLRQGVDSLKAVTSICCFILYSEYKTFVFRTLVALIGFISNPESKYKDTWVGYESFCECRDELIEYPKFKKGKVFPTDRWTICDSYLDRNFINAPARIHKTYSEIEGEKPLILGRYIGDFGLEVQVGTRIQRDPFWTVYIPIRQGEEHVAFFLASSMFRPPKHLIEALYQALNPLS